MHVPHSAVASTVNDESHFCCGCIRQMASKNVGTFPRHQSPSLPCRLPAGGGDAGRRVRLVGGDSEPDAGGGRGGRCTRSHLPHGRRRRYGCVDGRRAGGSFRSALGRGASAAGRGGRRARQRDRHERGHGRRARAELGLQRPGACCCFEGWCSTRRLHFRPWWRRRRPMPGTWNHGKGRRVHGSRGRSRRSYHQIPRFCVCRPATTARRDQRCRATTKSRLWSPRRPSSWRSRCAHAMPMLDQHSAGLGSRSCRHRSSPALLCDSGCVQATGNTAADPPAPAVSRCS